MIYGPRVTEASPVDRIVPEKPEVFPPEVRSGVGYALYAAQNGEMDPAAKSMKGFGGASVMEIVAPFASLHCPLLRRCLRASRISEEI
jgi:hypothetical protein